MNIITKFTVATEQGIDTLLMLTKELAVQKFSSLLDRDVLNKYITAHFNERSLIAEVNSISNQWLIVYAGNDPAGYARITSNGKRPEGLEGKRTIRVADLGILHKYTDPAIIDSLLEKCLTACRSYEAVWINEYAENPLLTVFEKRGFIRQAEVLQLDGLPLTSVYLILTNG